MSMYGCAHTMACVGGQRITCGSQFFPSTTWVQGIKLSLSGLVAHALFAEPSCWPSNIYFKLKSFLSTKTMT